MKRSTILVALLAVVFLVLTVIPAPAADPQFKWKAQTLWGAKETPHKMFEQLAQSLKVMTGGRLEITPSPPGPS